MKAKPVSLSADIISAGSVVGKCEHEGPLGGSFDIFDMTDSFGKKTWEQSESEMQRLCLDCALTKAKIPSDGLDALFAGDLQNQCVGSGYGLVDYDVPYFGLYGACSTAAEGMMLSAMLVSGKIYDTCAAITSSHYCAAERQYRTPLEYGSQRAPTAQWTVTGAGAFIISGTGTKNEKSGKEKAKSKDGRTARIYAAMPGIVTDKGINDVANMGAAMAPSALDTLCRYFGESGTSPSDYDLILTGDLGFEGGSILCDLMKIEGYDISSVYNDCGMIIYDRKAQDMHSGGSGCGCSAVIMASHILPQIEDSRLGNILFLGTGAMMSPGSIGQGLTIPAVAHLLAIKGV